MAAPDLYRLVFGEAVHFPQNRVGALAVDAAIDLADDQVDGLLLFIVE